MSNPEMHMLDPDGFCSCQRWNVHEEGMGDHIDHLADVEASPDIAQEWADRVDRLDNDSERIKHRQETLIPAFTVPRRRKKFSAVLNINTGKKPFDIRFESDTLEDLKHQIGQVQFLSLDGEVEARQKQWRIDNGIKAPKPSSFEY